MDLGGERDQQRNFRAGFTILSAVAEAEWDRIRDRVATMKADQRQRGRYLRGIMTAWGGAWTATAVRNVLARSF